MLPLMALKAAGGFTGGLTLGICRGDFSWIFLYERFMNLKYRNLSKYVYIAIDMQTVDLENISKNYKKKLYVSLIHDDDAFYLLI